MNHVDSLKLLLSDRQMISSGEIREWRQRLPAPRPMKKRVESTMEAWGWEKIVAPKQTYWRSSCD